MTTPEEYVRIRQLFLKVRELEPGEREEELERASESDEGIAQEVRALLADEETGFLEGSGSRPSREPTADPVVPGYRILREMGHGGMGTVFEAEQEATGQCVALKVLRNPSGRER